MCLTEFRQKGVHTYHDNMTKCIKLNMFKIYICPIDTTLNQYAKNCKSWLHQSWNIMLN